MNQRTEFHSFVSYAPNDAKTLRGRIDQAAPMHLAGAQRCPDGVAHPLPAVVLLHEFSGLGLA